MAKRIVIVGGGVGGLTAAHRLRSLAPDATLTVLEAGAHPGGLLRTESVAGHLCEHAANGFLGAAGGAADLCRELGVAVDAAAPGARRRWIWRHGALRPVPTSPVALLTSSLLSRRGRLRALVEPLIRKAPQGEESIAEFGRRRFGAEATDGLLAPFVLGVWAGDAEKLSFAAALPRIAALEERHGSVVVGMIASMLAARRAGAPRMAGLSAPREGMAALTDALAASVGDALRCGAEVTRLERLPDGAWRVHATGQSPIEADVVGLAIAPSAAARLVELPGLDAIEAVGVVVVHVSVALADAGPARDGFGFLVAEGEDPRCLGCVFESTLWPSRAPAGHALLRLIYGGARDPGVLQLGDDQLGDVVAADLRRTVGARASRVLRIARHPRAIPQYFRGHIERVALLERAAAARQLVLLGNGYHGVAVNDLVADGDRAARALLALDV